LERRAFGKTDMKVSAFCLGAMRFGWAEPPEKSLERLAQFEQAGGNFIDTANNYAAHHLGEKDYYGADFSSFVDGENERFIGKWMASHGNRNKIIIGTKLGFDYPGVAYGTSAHQIKEECEKSLKRLQTDYVDILYLHTDDRSTPLEETLTALDRLVKEGKVRYIGVSNFTAWRLSKAQSEIQRLGLTPLCCIQQKHSYLYPKPGWDFGVQLTVNNELLDLVSNSDLELLAYSPLLGGFYNNDDSHLPCGYGGNEKRLASLKQIATEVGATKNQLVYYWLMHSDPKVIPLISCDTSEQFEEALGALELKLTEEQMDILNKA